MTALSVDTRDVLDGRRGDRRSRAGQPGAALDLRDRRAKLTDGVRVSVVVPTLNEAANGMRIQ